MATVLGSKRKEDKGTASFPLGFKFNPTDEQLLYHYLKLKNAGRESEVQIIGEVDFYNYDPWDLPELSVIKSDQKEWFFFCRRPKVPGSFRINMATAAGYWMYTGKDSAIRSSESSAFRWIGTKKTLVFYKGRVPNGTLTDWFMYEYRATEGDRALTWYDPRTSPHKACFDV